jgi:hypothetical protein
MIAKEHAAACELSVLTLMSLHSSVGREESAVMCGSIRVALILAIAIGAALPAYGQRHGRQQSVSQVPRYTPQSPTVSPYLNLLNRNGTAASNYYGLVRPLQRQQAFNETQQQEVASQEQQIRSVQQQQELFEQPNVKPTGTAGWFQNYGTSAPYRVTSHYYGQWQTGKTQQPQQRRNTSARHF